MGLDVNIIPKHEVSSGEVTCKAKSNVDTARWKSFDLTEKIVFSG